MEQGKETHFFLRRFCFAKFPECHLCDNNQCHTKQNGLRVTLAVVNKAAVLTHSSNDNNNNNNNKNKNNNNFIYIAFISMYRCPWRFTIYNKTI